MRLPILALAACLVAPAAWAADPPPRQDYPTASGNGSVAGSVPMGFNSSNQAVPCGSSTVVLGCGNGQVAPLPAAVSPTNPTPTVTTTVSTIAAAGAFTKYLAIANNDPTSNVCVSWSATPASITSGICSGQIIQAGGGSYVLGPIVPLPPATVAITAISMGATLVLNLTGG